jgi:hypothetical protein
MVCCPGAGLLRVIESSFKLLESWATSGSNHDDSDDETRADTPCMTTSVKGPGFVTFWLPESEHTLRDRAQQGSIYGSIPKPLIAAHNNTMSNPRAPHCSSFWDANGFNSAGLLTSSVIQYPSDHQMCGACTLASSSWEPWFH